MDKLWRASGNLVRAVDNVGKQLDKVETLKTSKEKFKVSHPSTGDQRVCNTSLVF